MAACDVVEEEERMCARGDHVVGAVVDDVRAQRVVASQLSGDEDLRADAIDRRGEDGIPVIGEYVQSGEAAWRAEDFGAVGLFDGGAHEVDSPLATLDRDARSLVATPIFRQRRSFRRRYTRTARYCRVPSRGSRARSSSAPGGNVVGTVLQGELARSARDRVVAVEAGAAEPVLPLFRGGYHRIDREVGEGCGPDLGPDLLDRQVRAYQLLWTIHVDAVVAGALDRGRRDPEVDLGSAGLEEQLDQLAARIAAYDGVVHDDHPVAFYDARQGV